MSESQHYRYYDEWLKSARQHGFHSVDSAITELHKKHSAAEVARMFRISTTAICSQLRRLGISRRSRGGANNRKGRQPIHFVGNVPLKEWCRQNDKSYGAIHERLRRGQSLRFILDVLGE